MSRIEGLGSYDADLGMYVRPPQPPDLNRLAFLRYLAERGQLEHPAAGPAAGELVPAPEEADGGGRAP